MGPIEQATTPDVRSPFLSMLRRSAVVDQTLRLFRKSSALAQALPPTDPRRRDSIVLTGRALMRQPAVFVVSPCSRCGGVRPSNEPKTATSTPVDRGLETNISGRRRLRARIRRRGQPLSDQEPADTTKENKFLDPVLVFRLQDTPRCRSRRITVHGFCSSPVRRVTAAKTLSQLRVA